MKRKVTHFYRRSPNPKGWIQTMFITKESGSSNKFYALSNDEIQERKFHDDIEVGSLCSLERYWDIASDETIWIAPDNAVYISNAAKPFDGRKELIWKERMLHPYDLVETVVDSKLASNKFSPGDNILQQLYTESYWKILIDILIKKIKKAVINEKSFKLIGYVFAELHTIYQQEFLSHLEGHNLNYDGNLVSENFNWQIQLDPDNLERYVSDYDESELPKLVLDEA